MYTIDQMLNGDPIYGFDMAPLCDIQDGVEIDQWHRENSWLDEWRYNPGDLMDAYRY